MERKCFVKGKFKSKYLSSVFDYWKPDKNFSEYCFKTKTIHISKKFSLVYSVG